MWRMNYTIAVNLFRLQGILEMLHRIVLRPEEYTDADGYDYVRYIIGLMQKTGFIKTERFGEELLPEEGGYVLYPNHQGKYDAYSIVSVHDKPLSVMMNREQSYYPLVSDIVDVLRGKRLDVESPRHGLKIISEIADEVSQGRRYIIFPEGTYDDQKHNTLWDFKPGCFKAAVKAKAPIVPVALVDSYKAYNSWQITPVKTQVHFLEPITYAQYRDLNTIQIAAIVKDRIQKKLDEVGAK